MNDSSSSTGVARPRNLVVSEKWHQTCGCTIADSRYLMDIKNCETSIPLPLPSSLPGLSYNTPEAVMGIADLARWEALGEVVHRIDSCLSFRPFVRSRPSFRPDLRCTHCRRAQRRSRMARLRATALAARSVLDGRERDGMLGRVGSGSSNSPTIKKGEQKNIKKQDHAHWAWR
jgi:hypothetical protein